MEHDVTLIMAYGSNGVLGASGGLPWPHHAEDMRRFRLATLGKTVVMGRKTFDSIGRPLPYRRNIVVSRNRQAIAAIEGVDAASSMSEAIAEAKGAPVMVIGGAAMYALAMPFATRILLTEMHGEFTGDVYFKIPFLSAWEERSREEWREADGPCDFVEYRFRG